MNASEALRNISPQEFLALGGFGVAYIRPVASDGGTLYEVRAADGSEMGVFDDRELAAATLRQNGLEPLSVH